MDDTIKETMHEQAEMGQQNIAAREVAEALGILRRYKDGKANLEARIINEDRWWRRRHWRDCGEGTDKETPAGAQLFNAVENKVADVYDNIPDCSFLPRSADDEEAAKVLTSVMPCVLEQNGIENAYCDVARNKITTGTGCYAVVWDAAKLGGIGDISIKSVSVLGLYWEPGVTDIQDSPNLFYVAEQPNETILAAYPQLEGKLGGKDVVVATRVYEDEPDASRRTPVIDWYYKRRIGTNTVVHYVKICAGEVLFASENDPDYASRGWYDHGMYPFVPDTMFPLSGTPCGYGYISVGKAQQMQIDKLQNAIVRNSIVGATRRRIVREGSNVNVSDLADISKEVVTMSGSGDPREAFVDLTEPVLSGNYITVLQELEATLKETTANRDFAQGGTSGGVTSGTAISALVEAGNKQSRMTIRGSYEAYRKVVTMCLELVRQFYDEARIYRITGDDGTTQFVPFDNRMLRGQTQVGGVDIGAKEPVFDIKVRAHKQSPFARVTQNELMKEFFSMGFFAPQNATVALACLEGMEFDGKDQLKQRIEQNGTLYTENIELKQTALRLAAVVDDAKGTNLTQQLAQSYGVDAEPVMPQGGTQAAVEESPDVMEAAGGGQNKAAAARIAETTEV